MRWIVGRLIVQITLVCFILAGCRGQTLPATRLTPPRQTATITPLEQTTTSIPPTPTNTRANTQQPTQVEYLQILDISFTNPDHGWLLAATYRSDGTSGIAIRQTVDGGTTWTLVTAPEAQPASWMDFTSPNPNLVRLIRFLDGQTGWVFGPGLFFVHNGSKAWQSVELPGAVAALEPGGSNNPVWAITQTCSQMPNCSMQLYATTPDKPDQWRLVSTMLTHHSLLAFVRPDPMTGYILSNVTSDNFQVGLIATHDAGSTWVVSTTPCISEQPLLAASDSSHLFLVCTGLPGAGQQLKQFYTSTDDGLTWTEFQNPDSSKNIPSSGYADAVVFLSSKVGVLGLGRQSIIVTRDGGLSWAPAIPTDQDGGGWVLATAGPLDIFAATQGTIFRSLDSGLTWQSTEIH